MREEKAGMPARYQHPPRVAQWLTVRYESNLSKAPLSPHPGRKRA